MFVVFAETCNIQLHHWCKLANCKCTICGLCSCVAGDACHSNCLTPSGKLGPKGPDKVISSPRLPLLCTRREGAPVKLSGSSLDMLFLKVSKIKILSAGCLPFFWVPLSSWTKTSRSMTSDVTQTLISLARCGLGSSYSPNLFLMRVSSKIHQEIRRASFVGFVFVIFSVVLSNKRYQKANENTPNK